MSQLSAEEPQRSVWLLFTASASAGISSSAGMSQLPAANDIFQSAGVCVSTHTRVLLSL